MKLRYHKKSDALSIRFNNKRYFESDEVRNGVIFDFDKKGEIIAIEVLDASKKLSRGFEKDFKKKGVPIAISN